MRQLVITVLCAFFALGVAAKDSGSHQVSIPVKNYVGQLTLNGGEFKLILKSNTLSFGNSLREEAKLFIRGEKEDVLKVKWKKDDLGIYIDAPKKGKGVITVVLVNSMGTYGIAASKGSNVKVEFEEGYSKGNISFIARDKSNIKFSNGFKTHHLRVKAFDGSTVSFKVEDAEYIHADAYNGSEVDFEGYSDYVKVKAEGKSKVTGKGKTTTIMSTANNHSACELLHLDGIDAFAEADDNSYVYLGNRGDIQLHITNNSYVQQGNMELGMGTQQWGPGKGKVDIKTAHMIGGQWKPESFLRKSQAYEQYELKGKPHTVTQTTYVTYDLKDSTAADGNKVHYNNADENKIAYSYGIGSANRVRFIVFDEYGNAILKSNSVSPMGSKQGEQQYQIYAYKYNKHGDMIECVETVHTDTTAIKIAKYENEYNEHNRIVKQTEWLHDGKMRGYTKTYNRQMQVEEMSWGSNVAADSSATMNWDLRKTYKYDDRGNKVGMRLEDAKDSVLDYSITYKYSEATRHFDGRLKEMTDSRSETKTFITYNHEEEKRIENTNDHNGVHRISTVYKLDDYGNWTERRTVVYDERLMQVKETVTIQNIKYYE